MNGTGGNGWTKYEYHVLQELQRLSKSQKEMVDELRKLSDCVTMNRIKLASIAAVLGFIGGAIPVAVAVILKVL